MTRTLRTQISRAPEEPSWRQVRENNGLLLAQVGTYYRLRRKVFLNVNQVNHTSSSLELSTVNAEVCREAGAGTLLSLELVAEIKRVTAASLAKGLPTCGGRASTLGGGSKRHTGGAAPEDDAGRPLKAFGRDKVQRGEA